MKEEVLIKSETKGDVDAIAAVTVAAFDTLEISNHTEQFIIAALRSANALSVSLVAEADGRVVGHVAFSPVTISDGCANWYGLGPVSVRVCLTKDTADPVVEDPDRPIPACGTSSRLGKTGQASIIGHSDARRGAGVEVSWEMSSYGITCTSVPTS